jgi:hypothetical protein
MMSKIEQLKNFIETMREEWDIETDENGDLCFDYHVFWHDFNVISKLVDEIYYSSNQKVIEESSVD